MKETFEQQIKHLEKKENKLLNRQENPFIKSTISPVVEKISGKIPKKLKTTLETAFYKGFQLIFEKGTVYIEKTYDKDKLEMEYDINNYAVDKKPNKNHIGRLDKTSVQSKLINTSFSVVEGSVLGLLGVGLPDIPLFLSVVMKTIYETALSYGFGYDTKEEKTYILLLICGAITKGDLQKKYDGEVEQLGASMDQNIVTEVDFEGQMRITSDVFSEALLTAKFIQGIPIVGAVGGAVNYSILNRIASYAKVKYKKRYLRKKIQ